MWPTPVSGALLREARLRGELTPIAVESTHMLDGVPRILSLTPEGPLLEVRNVSRFEAAARRA